MDVEKALEPEDGGRRKKMKILCLHGFRTSGSFLRKQIGRWDPSIFSAFDLDFPDGIFPAGGKSEIEAIFPPPYFEWFQFNKEFTEYQNLEACISFLCKYISNNGPFHGILGFSQGATIAALLLGYKAKGKILQDQPDMKLFVSISGSKFRDPVICEDAYGKPIEVNSVHLIGDKDWLKIPSEDLAASFVDPMIIRHPFGHLVPRLDTAAATQLSEWTGRIAEDKGKHDGTAIDDGKSGGAAVENGKTLAAAVENGKTGGAAVENGKTLAAAVENGKTGGAAVENGDAKGWYT